MSAKRVGVWLDSYGQALKEALRAAAEDGFDCVQAAALQGALTPAEMSSTGRRHLARYLADLGLTIEGVGLEFDGNLGLAEPASADRRFAHVRDTVALARDLGATRVAVRIGGFGGDAVGGLTGELLGALAELSDRSGVIIAVQPADGTVAEVAGHVRGVGCDLLRVAIDTFLTPDVSTLENEIVMGVIGWTTVRDARRRGDVVEQTPYGAGDVDFQRLLGLLEQADYTGPLVLRNDTGGGAALRQGRMFFDSVLALKA